MNPARALLALAAATALPAASALRWSVTDSSCDGSPFSSLKISVKCNGSSSCGLGDTATVAGTMYATSSFSDSDVTLKPCALGVCPEEAQTRAGKICDWLSASDGQDCGSEGAYAVSYEQKIPEYDDIPSALEWLVSQVVTVNMIVGDEEECEAEGDNNVYGMRYSAAGAASLAILGLGAFAARRRRARGEDNEKATRFVEMTDAAVV
ncbi:hypothetical protein ACHAXT_011396 [Thalassiosira profunda]